MRKVILLLGYLGCFPLVWPLSATAQVSDSEKDFIERVQQRHPDFRIVKRAERFPERYNASVALPVRTYSLSQPDIKGALITLHDGTTGAPMESCLTPCTLHKSEGRKVFLSTYKRGFGPPLKFIQANPYQKSDLVQGWDGTFKVNMGVDFRELRRKTKACESKAAKMDKSQDSDAVPCYRTPPVFAPSGLSGYCKLNFDVSSKGRVQNLRATFCSDLRFESPSLIAIKRWSYLPKIERGMAVTRPDVETTMKFVVNDYDGTPLDENGNRVEE